MLKGGTVWDKGDEHSVEGIRWERGRSVQLEDKWEVPKKDYRRGSKSEVVQDVNLIEETRVSADVSGVASSVPEQDSDK